MSELEQTIIDFVEMRKTIKKPMTERAVSILRKRLDKLASDEQDKIEILEQSILNCWQGVFQVKGEQDTVDLFGGL